MNNHSDNQDDFWKRTWEVDDFIEEYNWEVDRCKRKEKQSSFFVEDKPKKKKDVRDHFIVKHTVIALCILGGIFALTFWNPFFWILFFVVLFLV